LGFRRRFLRGSFRHERGGGETSLETRFSASASARCGLFLEAPGELAVPSSICVGRPAGLVSGERRRTAGPPAPASSASLAGSGKRTAFATASRASSSLARSVSFRAAGPRESAPSKSRKKRLGIGRLHPDRHRLDAKEIPAELADLEAVRVEEGQAVEQQGGRDGIEFDRDGRSNRRWLATAPARNCSLQPLEPDALVGGAAIEDHHARGVSNSA
jgi:hypothetical protein